MFNPNTPPAAQGWKLARAHDDGRPIPRHRGAVILDAFRLDGKVALVTGSSAGLGAAIAVAFAEAGADVACHGNTRSPDATSAMIARADRQSLALRGDLQDRATPRRLIEETLQRF